LRLGEEKEDLDRGHNSYSNHNEKKTEHKPFLLFFFLRYERE